MLRAALPAAAQDTVPVQGGTGFTEDQARPGCSYCFFHGQEMLIDDQAQFSPESALFEISSNSANAFPAMCSAVLVLRRSRVSLSFFALSFLFSARSGASSAVSELFSFFSLFPCGFREPAGCCAAVLQMRMVDALFPQQGAALGAALRQRVVRRQDLRLVSGGERPALRPLRLSAAGHPTIMIVMGGSDSSWRAIWSPRTAGTSSTSVILAFKSCPACCSGRQCTLSKTGCRVSATSLA